MFKKLSVITVMSTVLIGGAFTNTVDASESANYNQNQQYQQYKVYYSFNGKSFSNSDSELNNYFQSFFKNYQVNWNNQNETNKPEESVKEDEEKEQEKRQQNKVEDIPKQAEPRQEAPSPQEPAKKQQQQSQSDQLNQYEQQVVELTNDERIERGLNPLKVDLELSKVAREKSRDMSANNYFSHTSPTYGSPFDMMKSYGISYRSAGENIAKGQRTPEEVVNGWMNSEGHRANILSSKFTHIGVGYIADGNYWTQQFIGK